MYHNVHFELWYKEHNKMTFWYRQGEYMDKIEYSISTEVIGTTDGRYTYEVRKRFIGTDVNKTAVVILLYPTVSLLSPYVCDSSTTYLLNRAVKELGYSDLRIVNIFDKVCKGKPSAKQLTESDENIEYLKQVFMEEKDKDTDIIVAWGSTLKQNEITKQVKVSVLKLLKVIIAENRIRQFAAGDLDTESLLTPHVLWMGLHCTEAWYTEPISVDYLLSTFGVKTEKTESKKRGRKKKEDKSTPDYEIIIA